MLQLFFSPQEEGLVTFVRAILCSRILWQPFSCNNSFNIEEMHKDIGNTIF